MGQRASEQVERLARMLWSEQFDSFDKAKIAHKYGFTKDEIGWLDWHALPVAIKTHIRDMAQNEIESVGGG